MRSSKTSGVLVGVRIEEMVTAAVLVGVFVRGALQNDALERIVGGHPEIEHLLGRHAADRHLDVGRHAWRSLELVVGDQTDFVVVTDGVSFAEVDDGSASHDFVGAGIGGGTRRGKPGLGGSAAEDAENDAQAPCFARPKRRLFRSSSPAAQTWRRKSAGWMLPCFFRKFRSPPQPNIRSGSSSPRSLARAFGDDAGQVGMPSKCVAEGRDIVAGQEVFRRTSFRSERSESSHAGQRRSAGRWRARVRRLRRNPRQNRKTRGFGSRSCARNSRSSAR